MIERGDLFPLGAGHGIGVGLVLTVGCSGSIHGKREIENGDSRGLDSAGGVGWLSRSLQAQGMGVGIVLGKERATGVVVGPVRRRCVRRKQRKDADTRHRNQEMNEGNGAQ